MRKQLLIVSLLVLVLRLPFLNQAVQGDDLYYLYGAEHAQIDPLHPIHAHYVFLGREVDMRGNSHPPFDSWYLGALLAAFGSVRELPFHGAYIPFSLIAAWAALWLARRFSNKPLLACFLFLATPAFVVNGQSLETDVPFAAFWLASIALYILAVDRRCLALLGAFAVASILAIFTAYQAILLMPILLLYRRNWKPAWIALLTAPALIGAWQFYERSGGGALPAAVLTGYMQSYGMQALTQKVRNAAALTAHLGWLVCPLLPLLAFRLRPIVPALLVGLAMAVSAFFDPNPLFWLSIGAGVLILVWCARHWRDFLAQWILLFFAAALILFFAGSARYLLPISLPLAILVSNRLSVRWLSAGAALGFVFSLMLAIVNYQHWDGYRQFARTLARDAATRRVWIDGEWGLRFYLEQEGALPLLRGQTVHPDEVVVSGELGSFKPATGGGVLSTLDEREITSPIPLRLVAMHGRSAYSTTLFGLRPFDLSTGPIDRVQAAILVAKKPSLEDLPMNSPQAAEQIVSGIYDLEGGQWRWTSGQAVLLLKAPAQPEPLQIRFTIPEPSPARQITVSVGPTQVARQDYAFPGSYILTTPPIQPEGDVITVTIAVDKTFSVPGDQRELGIILSQAGFK